MAFKRKRTSSTKWTVTKKGAGFTGGVGGSGWTRKDIKKEILKMAETKRFSNALGSYSGQLNANQYYAYNPLYWIGIGTNENQRIGDEIYIDSIDIAASVKITRQVIVGTAPNPEEGTWVYCAFVRANDEFKDGTLGPNATPFAFSDMRYSSSGNYCNPIIDTNQFTVLWSKRMLVNPTNFAQNDDVRIIRKKIKIGQKFKYKTTTSGYGKFSNYYLVFACNSASNNNNMQINPAYVVNFKDM